MNKMSQNGKKKRILRIILLVITGFIVVSGLSLFLLIQNYMNKINMDFETKTDTKAMETDVYYDNSGDFYDWNSSSGESDLGNIINKIEDNEVIEADDELIESKEDTEFFTGEEANEEEGQAEEAFRNSYGSIGSSDTRKTLNTLVENNVTKQSKLMDDIDIKNILFIVCDSISEAKTNNLISIILLSINQDEEVITSISFSEFIYLQIPDNHNDSLYKAYLYGGTDLLMETLQNNFRIKIDRYIVTDQISFQSLLETIGSDELNIDNMNQALNDILPCINTNLKEKEILSFLLMMPTYMNYNQTEYNIPIEKSYESFELEGREVLGIDFEKNIKALRIYLY